LYGREAARLKPGQWGLAGIDLVTVDPDMSGTQAPVFIALQHEHREIGECHEMRFIMVVSPSLKAIQQDFQ
jgi:hypothetical protein